MALITSTTALNKLKWGSDRFNAGATNGSNQPYITRDIPGVNVNNPNPTLFNDGGDLPAKTGIDFLLRNGFRAPADALADVSRLFQMFTDTRSPNGILFTAAQNLLSRTAVKTEASTGIAYAGGAINGGIYTPLSTLAQAGLGFTGTHLNLMGLDPTGLTGGSLNGYFETVKKLNDPVNFSQKEGTANNQVRNPLFSIDNLLPQILGSGAAAEGNGLINGEIGELLFDNDGDFENRLINLKVSKIASATEDVNIMSYGGGPGSILGVGKTHIKFADQRTGVNNSLAVSDPTYFYGTSGKNHYNLNPQSKDFIKKLGASIYAQKLFRAEEDKEEIISYNENEIIGNQNNFQSTIRNAELVTDGFFDTDNPSFTTNQTDNFSIFFRPDPNQINYFNKLGASISAEGIDIYVDKSQQQLENTNTTQSTTKNAKLSNIGFFDSIIIGKESEESNNILENNFSVFYKPYNIVNYLQKLGASVKAIASEFIPEGDKVLLDTEINENSLDSLNNPQSTLNSAEPTYLSSPLYGTGVDLQTYSKTSQDNNREINFFNTIADIGAKIRNPLFSINSLLPQILGSEGGTPNDEVEIEEKQSMVRSYDPASDFNNRLINLKLSKMANVDDNINIMSYDWGGGTENIRFADQRTGINNAVEISSPTYFYGSDGRNRYNLNPQSKDFLSKLGASIYAQQLFRAEEDREEILGFNTNEQILNENTFQSTIRNASLSTNGFFGVDANPNNFSIFRRPSNVYNELGKNQLFTVGASSLFITAFPSTEGDIYDEISRFGDGAIRNYENNVYQDNLVTIGSRNSGGPQWRNNTLTFTQQQLISQTSYQTNPQIQDFRKTIIESQEIQDFSSVLSLAPNYVTKAANRRVNRGDPGKTNKVNGQKDVFNYGLPANDTMALDKLTAMPMYDAAGPNPKFALNDFAKFRIAAINNEPGSGGKAVYMHFRAFIDGFSDSYNASWDPVKYSGRGDTLYNYTGFERGITMSFTVYAQSKAELIPMYKKLNYLASTLAPDYTKAGFMRGNLVRLTLGGYLYEQPGFISSLVYDVPQESTWEIAIDAVGGADSSVKELPHMIKVSNLSFTPIHNFLPQKPNKANNPNERYIALSKANNSRGNYADPYEMQLADGDGDTTGENDIFGE